MAAWTTLITAIPDALKGLFGLVDKFVEDKDKANEMKLGAMALFFGKDSKYWLPANAFSIAMLANYAMVIVLHFTDKIVPVWAIAILLLWLAGPLIKLVGRDIATMLFDVAREYYEQQKQKKGKK